MHGHIMWGVVSPKGGVVSPGTGQSPHIGGEVHVSVNEEGRGHDTVHIWPVVRVTLHQTVGKVLQCPRVARVHGFKGCRGLHYLQHESRKILGGDNQF